MTMAGQEEVESGQENLNGVTRKENKGDRKTRKKIDEELEREKTNLLNILSQLIITTNKAAKLNEDSKRQKIPHHSTNKPKSPPHPSRSPEVNSIVVVNIEDSPPNSVPRPPTPVETLVFVDDSPTLELVPENPEIPQDPPIRTKSTSPAQTQNVTYIVVAPATKSYAAVQPLQPQQKSAKFKQVVGRIRSRNNYQNNTARHPCQYCGRTFATRDYLIGHENLHTGDKIYECEHCPQKFQTRNQRRFHQQKTHQKIKIPIQKKHENPNKIYSDSSQFPADPLLPPPLVPPSDSMDIQVQNGMATCVCSKCNQKFGNLSLVIGHHCQPEGDKKEGSTEVSCQSELPPGPEPKIQSQPIICTPAITLKNEREKLRQKKKKRQRKSQNFVPLASCRCAFCGKVLGSEISRRAHERLFHTGERPFGCSRCDKSFPTHMQRRRHELKHEIMPIAMQIVGAENSNSSSPTRPLVKTHGSEKQREPAPESTKNGVFRMGMKRTKAIQLKMGRKISIGEIVPQIYKGKQIYICKFCMMPFSNSPEILGHIEDCQVRKSKVVDSAGNSICEDSELSITSVTAGGSVSSSSPVNKGLPAISPPIYFQGVRKRKTFGVPYNCGECEKSFKFPSQLKNHIIAVHSIRKPFKCSRPNCFMSFATNFELLRHENGPKHSAEKRGKKKLEGVPPLMPILEPAVEEEWPRYDPNGKRYCICPDAVFSNDPMVACDNDNCPIGGGWFHFRCVGLTEAPTDDHWFCPHCTPAPT